MTVAKSIALFVLAALAEIGGAWRIWQGWREHRGLWWIAGGIIALGAYGFVATFQPDPNFGRILAAYRGSDWSSAGSHAPPPTLAPGKDPHPQAGDSPTSPKSTSTASTTAKSPTPGPSRTTSSGLTQLGLLPNT